MIDIAGLDKADVLAALYNAAACLGMGVLHYDAEPMTREQAREILAGFEPGRRLYFDYLKGRVMKVDLSGEEFREGLYDRDNGEGAALKALEGLKPCGPS